MYRILGLVVVVALCIVGGCKSADGCDLFGGGGGGIFSGGGGGCGFGGGGRSYTPAYSGGCGSYGGYTPSYGGCGEMVISNGCVPDQTISNGCCPDQTIPDQTVPGPCDPVDRAPIPDVPLDPQEPNPKMTPVEDGIPDDIMEPELIMPGDAGTIKLRVPSNAVVIINGYRTKKTGTARSYRSVGLVPGRTYRYKVEILAGSERKIGTFSLQAGDTKQYAYSQFYPRTNTALVQK